MKRALAPIDRTPLNPLELKGGELLVSNLSASARTQLAARGFEIGGTRNFATVGALLTSLTLPAGMTTTEARAFLRDAAPDSSIAVNHRYRLYNPSSDEDGAASTAMESARETGGCTSERCYGANVIGWKAHLAKCAQGVRVGVIDTGIDMTHPALKRHRMYLGKIGPANHAASSEMHGTGVLALLAGDTKSSTPGLIPSATFYIADIFFPDEHGRPVSTTMHLLAALDWMAQLDVQIINLSLSGPRDGLVQNFISKMSRPRKSADGKLQIGTVFVAAAGNGGPGAPPSYPAAYPDVVAVTAVSKDLRSYRRANQGDYIDVAAPGVDIWTALPEGRQGFQSGTSFATPYMTAVVAALYKGLPAAANKEELLQRISVQDLGAPGRDRIYGRGLVRAPTSCEANPSPQPRTVAAPWVTTHTSAASQAHNDLWVVNVARSPAD
ncbi:MAG TPA: S8 family serine peptidase [Hyphomicrobiaceae bacterium]|nr:S8 family serine peptidase [Hyphomicrobiaceae bacterium]